MNDDQAGGFLEVFFENDEGGIVAFGGEGGDFADTEFVTVAVGGAANIFGVWEETC